MGTEHSPRCPDTVETQADKKYCKRALDASSQSEHAILLALEVMMDAAEPRWSRALHHVVKVLWFLRGWSRRRRSRLYWSFDGALDHRSFDTCTWSAFLAVPDGERRDAAFAAAMVLFHRLRYRVFIGAFNLPPVTVHVDRDPPTV